MPSDDQSGDGTDQLTAEILDTISADLGVCVLDEWATSDDYLFRGAHGRLEHLHYSEDLGQWKRGLYQVDEVLRNRLSRAIAEHPQFGGWHYVRRDELEEPEPVVVEISKPQRCSLCDERFPSGNAFGWHLADVHQIDTDDKMEFAVAEPESQHTLGKWADGSA